jgi:hypothetical protein
VRHEDDELFASPAEEEVGLAQGPLDAARGAFQDEIADGVPVTVVELLEAVEIGEQDADSQMEPPAALGFLLEDPREGAAVGAAGQAVLQRFAPLALAEPGEGGGEHAGGDDQGGRQQAHDQDDLAQARQQEVAARGARVECDLDRAQRLMHPQEDHQAENGEADDRQGDAMRVAEVLERRADEVAIDPGAHPPPAQTQDRQDEEQQLQEVADHPAAPDALAGDRIECVTAVPEDRGERAGHRGHQPGSGKPGEIAAAPQVGVDPHGDQRRPEHQGLHHAGDGEQCRERKLDSGGEGAGEVGEVDRNRRPGRTEPESDEDRHQERREDRHLERDAGDGELDAVPVQPDVEQAEADRGDDEHRPDRDQLTEAGAAARLAQLGDRPPDGAAIEEQSGVNGTGRHERRLQHIPRRGGS